MTRKRYSVATTATVLAVLGLVCAPPSQAAVTAPVDCPTAFPTSQADEGVEGTGFTVEKGNTPAAFHAEIIGRLTDGIEPGTDLIMAKVSSPAITRAGGVWAGMSGSPLYAADGRLIGALSYVLSAGPTDIAGFTPASAMLPLLGNGTAARTAQKARSVVRVPSSAARKLTKEGASASEASAGFHRLVLPLSVSGKSSAARAKLVSKVSARISDVRVVTGASPAEATAAPAAAISAGSNFVAAVSYGDVSLYGAGTTTFVCKGRAVAFGHPFFDEGDVNLSAHSASAVYVQPDPLFGPYKLVNPGGVVGTVDRDTLTGISARLGVTPRTTLVTAEFGKPGKTPVKGSTRVASETWVPLVSAYQVLTTSSKALGSEGAGSGSMALLVNGTRGGGKAFDLATKDHHASTQSIPYELGGVVIDPLDQIVSQPFETTHITSVVARGTVEPTIRLYRLARVRVKQAGSWVKVPASGVVLTAGKALPIRLSFASYRNLIPRRDVNLALAVPKSAAGKRGSVILASGSGDDAGYFVEPKTFAQLITMIESAPKNDEVGAALYLDKGPDGPVASDVERVDAAVTSFGLGFDARAS